MLVDLDLGGVVGEACHFEGLLDDGAGLAIAVDAVGVELEGGGRGVLLFVVFECEKGSPLPVDLILDHNMVDNRAEIEDILDIIPVYIYHGLYLLQLAA